MDQLYVNEGKLRGTKNKLPSLITPVANWRVEDGSEISDESGPDICHAPVIESQERETLWYTQHFSGREHTNFVGLDDALGPYAISMLRDKFKTRLILWLSTGVQTVEIMISSDENLSISDAIKKVGWTVSKKKLKEMKKGEFVPLSNYDGYIAGLMAASPYISQMALQGGQTGGYSVPAGTTSLSSSSSSWVSNQSTVQPQLLPRWEAELMRLEARVAARFQSYKFGILYVKAGQKTEEEMFSNKVSSSAFRGFCKILGEKVELKDWPFFNGGLDTKADRTGKHSLYTQHCGYDVMFHVSTMLPWNDGDSQQIDRKRHIGNDVIIIAFIDEDATDKWCPTIISSRFPHVYAVIKPLTDPSSGNTSYLFNLAIKETVSTFGPPLPNPPIFNDPSSFRHFLLSKLINGEREAIRHVPDFHQDSAHLSDLQDIYEKVSKSGASNSIANPGVVGDSVRSATSKDSLTSSIPPPNPQQTPSSQQQNQPSQPSQPPSDSVYLAGSTPGSISLLGQSSPSLLTSSASKRDTSQAITPSPSPGSLQFMGGSFNVPTTKASSRDLRSRIEASGALSPSSPDNPPTSKVSSRDLRSRVEASGALGNTKDGAPGSAPLPSTSSPSTQPQLRSSPSSRFNLTTTTPPAQQGDGSMTATQVSGSPSVSIQPSGSSSSDLSISNRFAPLSLYAATEQIQAFQSKPAMLNFPAEIVCADAWDGKLVVGTVDGLFVVELGVGMGGLGGLGGLGSSQESIQNQSPYGWSSSSPKLTEVKCLIHKGQPYRHNYYQQVTVIEELGVLIALIPKVGVVMYDLSSMMSSSGPAEILLRKTKGATLYSLGAYQGILQLAVSTSSGRGLVIHRWINDMFQLSQIIQIPPPTVMEFDSKGYIIAASPGEFSFIKPDNDNPTMNVLYSWTEKDMDPLCVLLFEDTSEYLLCFNLIGFFVNNAGHRTRSFEFKWLSPPTHILSFPPYLLIFTSQHLEVRYLSNGSLVQLLDLDTQNDYSIKFLTSSLGILFSTLSSRRQGLAHSSFPSLFKDSSNPNLSSSSGSSVPQNSKDLPSSSSQVLPPSNNSSSGIVVNSVGTTRDSVVTFKSESITNSSSVSLSTASTSTNPSSPAKSPDSSSTSASGGAFNTTLSTIHWLRLNSAHTSVVVNPLSQLSPISSFLALGLMNPGSVSLPPSAVLQYRKMKKSGGGGRGMGGAVGGTGGVGSTFGSGNGPVYGGAGSVDVSTGSSPKSPATSFLQQQQTVFYEGTASFDESEEAAMYAAAAVAQTVTSGGTQSSPQASSFRRKSPSSRESFQRSTINNTTSNVNPLHASNGSNSTTGSAEAGSTPPLMAGTSGRNRSSGSGGINDFRPGIVDIRAGSSLGRSTSPLLGSSNVVVVGSPNPMTPGQLALLKFNQPRSEASPPLHQYGSSHQFGSSPNLSNTPPSRGNSSSPSPLQTQHSSSGKVSRRKSMAFEVDMLGPLSSGISAGSASASPAPQVSSSSAGRRKKHNIRRKSSDFSHNFDFEDESMKPLDPRLSEGVIIGPGNRLSTPPVDLQSESSESPRRVTPGAGAGSGSGGSNLGWGIISPVAQGSSSSLGPAPVTKRTGSSSGSVTVPSGPSPIIHPKSHRTPSDRLSGSGERSPHSSPIMSSPIATYSVSSASQSPQPSMQQNTADPKIKGKRKSEKPIVPPKPTKQNSQLPNGDESRRTMGSAPNEVASPSSTGSHGSSPSSTSQSIPTTSSAASTAGSISSNDSDVYRPGAGGQSATSGALPISKSQKRKSTSNLSSQSIQSALDEESRRDGVVDGGSSSSISSTQSSRPPQPRHSSSAKSIAKPLDLGRVSSNNSIDTTSSATSPLAIASPSSVHKKKDKEVKDKDKEAKDKISPVSSPRNSSKRSKSPSKPTHKSSQPHFDVDTSVDSLEMRKAAVGAGSLSPRGVKKEKRASEKKTSSTSASNGTGSPSPSSTNPNNNASPSTTAASPSVRRVKSSIISTSGLISSSPPASPTPSQDASSPSTSSKKDKKKDKAK